MADIVLGGKTYEGIGAVRLDTADGGTVEFADRDATFEAGRLAGVEEGKQEAQDGFWDAYQSRGNRDDYDHAFAGVGWNNQLFRPKYPLSIRRCLNMFTRASLTGDLAQILEELGITLDTSNSRYMANMFSNAMNITRIPKIDFTSCDNTTSAYYSGIFIGARNLVTIDAIVVTESNAYANWFNDCLSLKNLTVEGTIGQNGFNAAWSPLSKASLCSIVNALSGTTQGLTVTLRLDAVNTAFETREGAADGATSDEWAALLATKPNWTISLI